MLTGLPLALFALYCLGGASVTAVLATDQKRRTGYFNAGLSVLFGVLWPLVALFIIYDDYLP